MPRRESCAIVAAIDVNGASTLPHPCVLNEVNVGSARPEGVEVSVPGPFPTLAEGDPAGVPEPGVRNNQS